MNTKQIRQKILDLAIRGELVPQDPTDEPASVLLERIRTEKEQLIKDKKLKRDKKDNEPIDEVPFELPEGWEWCRLGEIGNNIQYGLSNPSSTFGKYKILRITDIQNNSVSWDTVPFVDIEEDEVNSFLLKKGDILFARTGATVGKSYLVSDLPYSTVFASYLIRISVFEVISIQYIKYFFESDTYWNQITDKSVGIGQPNVNGTSLKTLLIPLPPLAEQHRIVQIAEQLLTIIDTIKLLQEELKDLVKQTKNQVLNYAIAGKLTYQDPNEEPAEELLKRIGKTTATDTPYEKLPEGWACTQLQVLCQLLDGEKKEAVSLPYLDVAFLRGRTESNYKESGRYIPKNTHLILVDGENSGEIFTTTTEGYQGSTLKILNISKEINEQYLFYVLKKEQQLFKESKTGSAIPHLNKKLFKELKVLLPPLVEQHRIVQQIETFFASFDQIEKELA
jgi:restriction modification system DNA specificity domain protein